MQQREYKWLCDAILQKCETQQWYGPDMLDPRRTYIVEDDDPRKLRFTFPPATKDQLRETEVMLGFPLPAILQALYTKVANGDFGPAYGLRGIIGGAPEANRTLVAWYQKRVERCTLFDFADIDVQPEKYFMLPDCLWPRSLLAICDWGCGIDIGIECVTGHVLSIGPEEEGYSLSYVTDSFEKWLEEWMREEATLERRIDPQQRALDIEHFLYGGAGTDYF